jgi:8-oxo-dGTP pyrophosphatase MutT (NUDIX family)
LTPVPDHLPPPPRELMPEVVANPDGTSSRAPKWPEGPRRDAAVLILIYPDTNGDAQLVLTERSPGGHRHAGQISLPGGAIDATDQSPAAAALREAAEEVGLDPGGVDVVGTLPEVFIPRTGFRVVPVLAWWRQPSAVAPVDAGEVAAVERVSVTELADPATRLMVQVRDGRTTPAFRVRGMLIWGFTAALVDRLLALGGWEKPWDVTRIEDLETTR